MKVLHWSPRIICILAILFISMFAMDAFTPGLSIWKQLAGFFIHLIPSFVLLTILIISWKWEMIGGIIFLVIGLGLSPFIYKRIFNMNHSIWISLGIVLVINIPFVIVGVLFIINHFFKKKHLQR